MYFLLSKRRSIVLCRIVKEKLSRNSTVVRPPSIKQGELVLSTNCNTKLVQFSVNIIMVMQKGSKQLYNFKLYTFLRIFNVTADNLVISSHHSRSFPGNETWPVCFITLWLCPAIQAMPHNNNKIPLLHRWRYFQLSCFVISKANLRDTERGISQ